MLKVADAGAPLALYDVASTRRLEAAAAARLPALTLMQRAGLAAAQLALAVAPHARRVWIACGPGNNGGDGFEAALHLQRWHKAPQVTWLGTPQSASAETLAAYQRAVAAGVQWVDAAPADCDLCIDALLGLGVSRAVQGDLAATIEHINRLNALVLAVDLPSGLHADTGNVMGLCVQAQHTLSLLTLKPGLYTAQGRDHAGEVWLDTLLHSIETVAEAITPRALLAGPPVRAPRAHASHKGSYGDVAIIGGAPGMSGAALLAARAALHHGAGRVFVALLDGSGMPLDAAQPELMLRAAASLNWRALTAVCGCGGGTEIAAHLPTIFSQAPRLVVDADALNAIAADTLLQQLLRQRHQRQQPTVLTPHPLEAARLLGYSTAHVQTDRLHAAEALADKFQCDVVLKGSGSVVSAPGQLSSINPTGSARLASAGTGDVLAGMVGAALAAGKPAYAAARDAVYQHGLLADRWPVEQTLTASALASSA